jgi:hypothetical protein
MKHRIAILILLLLSGCKGEKTSTYLTPDKALNYFKGIKEICDRDNGTLWGKNLYGPIMFVDRASRSIVANMPDKENLLKGKDGVFTGLYPKDLLISNTPVMYGGTMYAMTPLPSEEDDFRIKTQAVHSLFHRFQKIAGTSSFGYNTNNMDEKEARLWIKLEWKALRKALTTDREEQKLAIRDALIFRGANRELYQKYAKDENLFENYEGLATFTYTLLCTQSQDEYKARIFENLDRVYSMQSYSRSYGFIHGALYASLLKEKGFDFSKIKTNEVDLGNSVKELYNIELPSICRDVAGSIAMNYNIAKELYNKELPSICRDVAGSIAMNYNIAEINHEEEQRLADLKESIHKQISIFTEKPVVFVELESPYFDFEPEDIHSLDTLGTLYNSIRVSDNWGKLMVNKGGCLVSNNFKFLRITAKGFKKDQKHISGEDWVLILNNDYELVAVNQNYFIRKLMP